MLAQSVGIWAEKLLARPNVENVVVVGGGARTSLNYC